MTTVDGAEFKNVDKEKANAPKGVREFFDLTSTADNDQKNCNQYIPGYSSDAADMGHVMENNIIRYNCLVSAMVHCSDIADTYIKKLDTLKHAYDNEVVSAIQTDIKSLQVALKSGVDIIKKKGKYVINEGYCFPLKIDLYINDIHITTQSQNSISRSNTCIIEKSCRNC